jgi:hypothetical protein
MNLKFDSVAAGVSDRYDRIVASSRFAKVMLISLVAWEVGMIFLLASRKPLWYDELLTFHFSSLQPFSRFWEALQAGADGMPVGYYLIIRLVSLSGGDPHVILRLPSLLGYGMTLLGIYWFVSKRLPTIAGLIAVVLVTLSPFRAFALEARSYSLMVGFLAISAVLWQRIDEKPLMTALLALFLALCVCSHYYAILAVSSLGAAEVAWTLCSRRIRWGVWGAFLVAAIPFFLGVPILLRFRNVFGENFWSKPSWSMVLTTYDGYLGIDFKLAVALVLLFALSAAQRLVEVLRGHTDGSAGEDFTLPEIVLIASFLIYPALLVVLTKVLGGGYVSRYGWPAILGMAVGSVFLIRATTWFRPFSPQLFLALLLVFAYQARVDVSKLSGPRAAGVSQPWIRFAELSGSETDAPVVIGSPLTFLEASQYSPPGFRERLVQLVTNKGTRLIARFIPLRFEDMAAFQAAHSRFFFCSGGFGDGITQYLLKSHYHLTLLSDVGDHALYAVEGP